MNLPRVRAILMTAAVLSTAVGARSQGADLKIPASLTAAQIVERMQSHDRKQTQDLGFYKTLRHYEVVYNGFGRKVEARMDVEADYDASSGKSLEIVSQSGSKFLLEKVLKRAVDSEREAFHDRKSTALTTANYRFKLLGEQDLAGHSAYILNVEPLVPSKFLYRGKIWVDAADFAMVKMETEPAKSPSFWISRTLIHYTGVKTDGFWMPQEVRSETSVRIGGMAVLTIDYGNYQIASSRAMDLLPDLPR